MTVQLWVQLDLDEILAQAVPDNLSHTL